MQVREKGYQRPPRLAAALPPAIFPEDTLSYLANVYNQSARKFYEKHGVKLIAAAYEANKAVSYTHLDVYKRQTYWRPLCYKTIPCFGRAINAC